MFSIGEFSKITGLTVKTLRYYHHEGLLEPTFVESGSGYRFYAEAKIETARAIAALRDLEFSIADIKEILRKHNDCDTNHIHFLAFMQSHRAEIQRRLQQQRRIARLLDEMIKHELEVEQVMSQRDYQVEQKDIRAQTVASLLMQGKYSDCGKGFGKIGRAFGGKICGKGMMLCYDAEYREDDANFEVAMPIKKGTSTDDIVVKELPGGRCLSLMHVGPYTELSRAYEKILTYAKDHRFSHSIPSREIYHKGPGIIFRGNPQKYLTEIQLMLD